MTTPVGDFLGLAGQLPPWSPAAPVSFTVVVRTQGQRPNSLVEALTSLTAQDYAPHQILVMVHHDEIDQMNAVAAAITAFSDTTAHHVQEGGRSRPLNKALDLVTSDYVCFLDDDDLTEPNWLSSFAAAIEQAPGKMIRARAGSQPWSTDNTNEPVRPIGHIDEPFAPYFDLLAHLNHNQTPICSIAVPAQILEHFSLRFAEELPVLEDWDFLVRVAMHAGVHSIAERTSLYRRLDTSNSDMAETIATWENTHTAIIDRFAQRPVVLPAGDSRRLASAHFIPGGGSQHEAKVAEIEAELSALTKSPWRWSKAFAARIHGAIGARIARQPR